MADKRRGFLIIVMVLSVLAFAGFSLAPLVGGIINSTQQTATQPTPTPTQTINAKVSDLQAQARGYELVLQREPENQTALRGLLETRLELVRLQQGEVKDVIPPLEKLSKLNPSNTEYSILLAQAQAFSGDPEAAAQIYRGILQSKPGDIRALQGLSKLLMEQKRPEAAIGLLQDTLKAAPQVNQVDAGSIDVVSVQLILGQIYAGQGRYDEAIAVYDEAMKGDPQDFRPVLAKGIIFKEQGKTKEAEPLFKKAQDMAPANYKDQIKQQATATPVLPNNTSPNNTSPSPSPNNTAGGVPTAPTTSPSPATTESPSGN